MNINELYPSKYLDSKTDFGDGDLVLTIKSVTVETLGQGERQERKPIIYFQEVSKGLACNKTNATTITGLYGAETDKWIGKRIALFTTEVDFQGKQTLAIRVRMKAPNGNGVASGDLTLDQALAELAKVGLGKEDLRQILPEKDGKRTYSPSRDSDKVRELVLQNTPAAEEQPF